MSISPAAVTPAIERSSRRPHEVRRAAALCAATVAWNLLVGGAAVLTAALTGSLALIGFGINAVVDSSVSVLLVWRFSAEARGSAERALRAEQVAMRLAGFAFSSIAVYLAVRGVRALGAAHSTSTTWFGIAEAAAALLVLPYLAVAKLALSRRLGSVALRADSLLTASGIVLAAAALAGLLLQRLLGWWWADPVAALAIAALLAWQALDAWRGAR